MAKDTTIIRFLKNAGIQNVDDFDLHFVSSVKSSVDSNFYTFTIKKDTGWDYPQLDYFLNQLFTITDYKFNILYLYDENLKNEKLIKLIFDWYFNNAHEDSNFKVSYSQDKLDNKISLIFNTSKEEKKFEQLYLNDLTEFFKLIGYGFEFVPINLETPAEIKKERQEIAESNVFSNKEELFAEVKKLTEDELIGEAKINYEKMLEERRQKDLFKKGGYEPFKIIQIDSNSGPVDINGRVFEVDSRETRNGKLNVKIGLDDGTDAIYVSFYSNETSLKKEDLLSIYAGQNLRVKGRANIDNFRKDLNIVGHYFYALPPEPLREDNAKEKRVELHLHTKYSDMDGCSTFQDYIQLAKNMGHKAIAINDHAGVQGFPNAQELAKKTGIKVIYGSELYVIDDFLNATINPDNRSLNKTSYVVLDTETTGLSIKYDRITEIGAVKVVNGMVVERIDYLINPEIDIPEEIQKITNITNEMVKDKPTIKEVLPLLLKFLEGTILVTHNLEFDYGMIDEAMKVNGFGSLKIPGIDTLTLSRYLFPENVSHRLGALCKRFEVEYSDTKAHRADYDAEVLANVWMIMRVQLTEKNKDLTVLDLSSLPMPEAILKHYRNTYHINAIIKNSKGTKELFEIMSDCHINHIGMYPFTTRNYLASHRENLLLGSSCFNGEVFQAAMIRSDDILRKAIRNFDFIEIQPLENYSFLLNTHQIFSEERLKVIIKNIIKIAKEENKIVVATGDVHYRDPSDKIYRDVIISAKQVGGLLHPLNSYSRKEHDFENPDQHYRSTEEMLECFSWLGEDKAKEFVITNSNKIADMCDTISPIKLDTYSPKIENSEQKLTDLVYTNAHRIYGEEIPQVIEERIKSELNGIISNGYSVIYYIAYALVKKAHDDKQIVGSRGSVGSSLVATLAGITEVNPLPPYYLCPKCKHLEFYPDDSRSGFDLEERNCPICGEKMISDGQSIPFQTFLGFNADKTPDIDLNFAADYQAQAHNYTKVLLGENNVFRAGTISKVQFKTAYGYVRNYFEEKHVDPDSIHGCKVASIAYGLTDIKRTTGQHPGGIVVVPNEFDVNDFTPVQYPADDKNATWKTTHIDYNSMHDTLLKLDILGHVDPQAMKMMCDLTHIDIEDIPLNDKKVLSLFTSDEALNLSHRYLPKDNGALGLPEFGTEFVRQVLRESKPKSFQDLVIISGLTHGTDVWNKNAQDLIINGGMSLKDVIGCRDDIMVYLINKGLDPHDAFVIMETVRKKDRQLSVEQIQKMLEHNVPEYYIDSCKKIKYLFPKGHATAYVMMAVRVGFIKVYHPLEYYATFLTLRVSDYDIDSMISGIDGIYEKLEELRRRRTSKNPEDKLSVKENGLLTTLDICLEMAERGIKIENISIEKSESDRFIIDYENNSLIPPFNVLDGCGSSAGESLIAARKERSFTSKEDFEKRSGLSKTNIKMLEKLGALKDLKDSDNLSLFDFNF